MVVFARAPEIGRVKTRLAAELGADAALAAYRELGSMVIAELARAMAGIVDRCVVAFTPSNGGPATEAWLRTGALRFEPQVEGDLGQRMQAAVEARFVEGAERVLVLGTDCPGIDAAVVAAAFDALDDADAVFGPALDGGYYLVGLRTSAPAALAALFEGVPWSSANTLAVTLERAAAAGLQVGLLAPLRDVDTADDWRAWQAARATADHGGGGPSSGAAEGR